MYHYWADVAPLAAKLLRMLLLLPGGDREKGLREMLESRERVAIVAGEADFQLHWIYLWFEKNPTEALRLVKSLGARYPTNPLFLQRIAEIECEARHDHRASAAAWESLLNRALQKQVEMPSIAETRSRLGLAHELVEMSQPQQAIDVLNAVIQARATAPYAAQSIAHVHLGAAYDRLGKRDLAVTAYNNAIALMPADAPADIRTRARDGLRKRAR
jgi:predicted Zn-dependent protease